MSIDIHKVLGQLPRSWQEMTLKQFSKIENLEMIERFVNSNNDIDMLDSTLYLISKLTDTSVNDLEELPSYQIIACAQRLTFLHQLPERDKVYNVKFKDINKITYDEYLMYLHLIQQPMPNMIPLFKLMVLDKTEDEIENMNMLQCHQGFFLFVKTLKTFVNRMKRNTRMKLFKQRMMRAGHLFKMKRERLLKG